MENGDPLRADDRDRVIAALHHFARQACGGANTRLIVRRNAWHLSEQPPEWRHLVGQHPEEFLYGRVELAFQSKIGAVQASEFRRQIIVGLEP